MVPLKLRRFRFNQELEHKIMTKSSFMNTRVPHGYVSSHVEYVYDILLNKLKHKTIYYILGDKISCNEFLPKKKK